MRIIGDESHVRAVTTLANEHIYWWHQIKHVYFLHISQSSIVLLGLSIKKVAKQQGQLVTVFPLFSSNHNKNSSSVIGLVSHIQISYLLMILLIFPQNGGQYFFARQIIISPIICPIITTKKYSSSAWFIYLFPGFNFN